MSCCPPNSISTSFFDNYTEKGSKSSLPNVEYYQSGSPTSSTAIVCIPDIFGWGGGRTRAWADLLAESLGTYVVVPKLLCSPAFEGGVDGDALPIDYDIGTRTEHVAWLKVHSWEDSIKPKVMALIDHLNSQGMTKIGLIGFCWGAWTASHIAAERTDVVCCISPHPSITIESGVHGGDTAAMMKKVKVPFLFMPAGNDPPTYLPEGEIYEIVKANSPASQSVPFPEMNHGWSSRGDMAKEAVRRDVQKAMDLTIEYFTAHLK